MFQGEVNFPFDSFLEKIWETFCYIFEISDEKMNLFFQRRDILTTLPKHFIVVLHQLQNSFVGKFAWDVLSNIQRSKSLLEMKIKIS